MKLRRARSWQSTGVVLAVACIFATATAQAAEPGPESAPAEGDDTPETAPTDGPESAPATMPASAPAADDCDCECDCEEKKPAPKKPKYELNWLLKGGAILTTGNARTFTLSAGTLFDVKRGRHKISAEGGLAYVRSGVLIAIDDDPVGDPDNGTIEEDELSRDGQITSASWLLKTRYDFFIIDKLSAYLSLNIGGDRPAGKVVFGGGQIGLSYTIFKNDNHELLAELGYDLSYEDYVDPATDSILVHSLRAFVGYKLKVAEETAIYANIEGLFNLNKEDVPTANGDNEAGPFEDTRIIGKAGLSTKLWKRLAFSFGFTAKYDNVPAPLAPFPIPFAAGFVPLSEKLDTITEASLVLTLL